MKLVWAVWRDGKELSPPARGAWIETQASGWLSPRKACAATAEPSRRRIGVRAEPG